ncbi:MAG: hypothetical protein V4616_11920, partial [Bacteroidota bacterium]
IPHRAPFVMVGDLLEATPERIRSRFTVFPDNILCENGTFSEAGLIENIAQTCAAGFGYLDRQQGGAVKLGFIGAISKLTLFQLPATGSVLDTTAETITRFQNVILVKGTSTALGAILLECEMKIVVISEDEET